MKITSLIVITALLVALDAQNISAQSGYELYQRALTKERAVGDVEEALRLYRRVVSEFGKNRALAAKAQYRMGLLHDRLGQKAEAQRAYKAVVGQYPDQTDMELMRTCLVRLHPMVATSLAWTGQPAILLSGTSAPEKNAGSPTKAPGWRPPSLRCTRCPLPMAIKSPMPGQIKIPSLISGSSTLIAESRRSSITMRTTRTFSPVSGAGTEGRF